MKKNYNDIDFITQQGNLDIQSKSYILLTVDIEISKVIRYFQINLYILR